MVPMMVMETRLGEPGRIKQHPKIGPITSNLEGNKRYDQNEGGNCEGGKSSTRFEGRFSRKDWVQRIVMIWIV